MHCNRFRVSRLVPRLAVAVTATTLLFSPAIAADVSNNGSNGGLGANGVDGAPPTDGSPGQNGGNSVANAAGASGSTNNANAQGGSGGSGGIGGHATVTGFPGANGGNGGAGGNGQANSTTTRTVTTDATSNSFGYAGYGGHGGSAGFGVEVSDPPGAQGIGGGGGNGIGNATATGRTGNAYVDVRGGSGGDGRIGGNGGTATGVATANSLLAGENAEAIIFGFGGHGGTGSDGNGGNGAATILNNAAAGNTNGGVLSLRQQADGGSGGVGATTPLGSTQLHVGGNGGNATSTISTTNIHVGGTDTNVDFRANGGMGGSAGVGGNGGDVATGFSITDNGNISMIYSANAGGGGSSLTDPTVGPVGAGGSGGAVTLQNSLLRSTGGGDLSAFGFLSAGDGGGTDNGIAVQGRNATITQAPTLDTTGRTNNAIWLQAGSGGSGGQVDGADGGNAMIEINRAVSNAFHQEGLQAFGGTGGDTSVGLNTIAGDGGSASVATSITSTGDLSLGGTAYGGVGGGAGGTSNHGGAGGNATTSVFGSTTNGSVGISSSAYAGNAGSVENPAAHVALGGNANAYAAASGTTSASASADARSGYSTTLNSFFSTPVADGTAIAQSEANGPFAQANSIATGRNSVARASGTGESGGVQAYVDSDVDGIAPTAAVRVQAQVNARVGTSVGGTTAVQAKVEDTQVMFESPIPASYLTFDLTPELFVAPMFGPLSSFSSDPSGLGLTNPLGLTGEISASNDAMTVSEQLVTFSSTVYLSPENFGGGNLTDAELMFGFGDVAFTGTGFEELTLALGYGGSQSWSFAGMHDFMDFVDDGPISLGLFTSNTIGPNVDFSMTWRSSLAGDAFSSNFFVGTAVAVPEPSSMVAVAIVTIGVVVARRRRQTKAVPVVGLI